MKKLLEDLVNMNKNTLEQINKLNKKIKYYTIQTLNMIEEKANKLQIRNL